MNAPMVNAMPILMIGLNHKVAPLEIRERLAFAAECVKATLRELIEHNKAITESVLLSTCNRTEVYVYTCRFAEAESQRATLAAQELLIQAMGKAIVNKLLHEPTIYLRELPPEADLSTCLRIVQDLYHIP